MRIPKVGPVAGAAQSAPLQSGKEQFGKVLESAGRPGQQATPQASEVAPRQVGDAARPGCVRKAQDVASLGAAQRVAPKAGVPAMTPGSVLDRVGAAQKRLDHILQLAQSGKSFSPAELLAMQAQIHRASQELDLAGKVVEKATGGVKQVLQTQV
jgi:hypothetical protein